MYEIELYNPFLEGFSSPIRAQDFQTAYVDVQNDGHGAGDPVLVYLGGVGISFVAYVPSGGDGNLGSNTVSVQGRASIELDAGILTNPTLDRGESVQILLTSVDPDTGDFNDRQGADPLTYYVQNPLFIGPYFTDGFESADLSAWSSAEP